MTKKVEKALKDSGAVLHRISKHFIYKFPNGALVTISVSASDKRAELNQLADIRRALRK
jgi:hypothetical protein